MVISRPLCAVQHAQDHDGLLEFGEVKTNEAVASSMRAASEPRSQAQRNYGVHRDIEPLKNKAILESTDIDSPVRRSTHVLRSTSSRAFWHGSLRQVVPVSTTCHPLAEINERDCRLSVRYGPLKLTKGISLASFQTKQPRFPVAGNTNPLRQGAGAILRKSGRVA